MPLARELRSSPATRTAVLMGKNVSYVKGARLLQCLKERSMTEEASLEFARALLKEGLVVKAEQLDAKKKTLRMSQDQEFDEKAFLVWKFEGSTRMRNLLLGVIVASFFGLVLFPVWPQSAKVGVWYLSMTLLLVLTGFILLRVLLFFALYGMGIDFWILPNFFADDLGFFESFRPVYTVSFGVEEIKKSWPYRVAVVACLAAAAYWVLTQPTEFDEFVASQRAFVDELYEGTLLSDKSQKEKEKIDKLVPTAESVEQELEELERLSKDEERVLEKNIQDMVDKDEQAEEEQVTKDQRPKSNNGNGKRGGRRRQHEAVEAAEEAAAAKKPIGVTNDDDDEEEVADL